MQKPRDWREGMKHSSTAQTMRHLRIEVMKLCEGAGLYQIDLLNGSKERVSEAEYWARRRGQLKLDRENAALTAAGQPPKQKKFETVKDTLRKQISDVLNNATSFEDFSDRLLQQYGIAVKESRGCLSYLPTGRAKFIRAKHLGDKFDKAAVLATLQANAERKPKVQSKPTNLAKLIDIQAKLTEGKGIGYECWAKKFNLKAMSQTLILLQEKDLLNEDDLRIYSLLFREMEYSINRMEANDKIYMMNRKLQEAAVTDMLTGIYNRAGMYEEIQQMIKCYSMSEETHHVGLMFIDLDNFKHYNDTFGHDVGDLILKEMAKIFRKAVKGRGFVARYGGDEFIMILNTDDREILEQIAKGIYEKINSTQGFQRQIENYLGHAITTTEKSRITCSIGIASAGDVRKEEDINELIRSADEILYKVKTGEKGHYAFLRKFNYQNT